MRRFATTGRFSAVPRVLVIASRFAPDCPGRRRLADAGFEVIDAGPGPRDEEALAAALEGYDAVIAGDERYTEVVMVQAAMLKTIARWGVGVDSVDLDAATRLGIVVTNTPGLLVDAVADLTFALLLAVARRVAEGDRAVRAGQWSALRGSLVWGKTLGIVGVGAIGTAVARRALGFNMTVLGCDPRPREDARELGVRYVSLEELLREADFVSLNAPATAETCGIIGARELTLMKPTAFLINTGRGVLVDQGALYEALRDGRIAGAGLDVLAQEPPDPADPLLRLSNCVLMPHSGSNEHETVARINCQVAENVIEAFGDEAPQFCVNQEVWVQRRR